MKLLIYCPTCRGPMRLRHWETTAVWKGNWKNRKPKARIIKRRHPAYWCSKCKVGCRIVWKRFWT